MTRPARFAVIVAALAIGGCMTSPPIEVPLEAELVWLGQFQQSTDLGDFERVTHNQTGQMYLVDDASGKVEAVVTVTPDHPRFNFDNVDKSKKYRLYFAPQSEPASRPTVIQS
jgi:hypothetical protein